MPCQFDTQISVALLEFTDRGAERRYFLLLTIGQQYFTSAQETKRSPEVAKTDAHEEFVARGKYIVEGLAGCGYSHTPRDENSNLDRTKWLAGAPVFVNQAQKCQVGPLRRPGLPAHHLGATPR